MVIRATPILFWYCEFDSIFGATTDVPNSLSIIKSIEQAMVSKYVSKRCQFPCLDYSTPFDRCQIARMVYIVNWDSELIVFKVNSNKIRSVELGKHWRLSKWYHSQSVRWASCFEQLYQKSQVECSTNLSQCSGNPLNTHHRTRSERKQLNNNLLVHELRWLQN